MDKVILKRRTKQLAITVGNLVLALPYNVLNKNYSHQITRSSSSVGANYRAACRAKSTADFINKLKIVEEELDETMFFIELIEEFNAELKQTTQLIWHGSNELLSIMVASINTLRSKQSGIRKS